jgi:glycyl-tRNA synthetase alpha chain
MGKDEITYRDVFLENERQFSRYSFEAANTDILFRHFQDAEEESRHLLTQNLPLPAYDQCLKASHIFNLLDARGMISVTERASYIARVREIAKGCCQLWAQMQGSVRI